jgi:hypothetical protein
MYQWEVYNLEVGMYFDIIPYVYLSVENLNYFAELGENFISTCESNFTDQPGVTYDYSFDNSTENIYFESWLGGDLVGNYTSYLGGLGGTPEIYSADLSFGNNFQVTINKTTGIIVGMGYRGWTKGQLNQSSVKVSMEYEYEYTSYKLPRFSFGTYRNYFMGFKILYGIIPLGIGVGIFVPLYYRRKKLASNHE